MRWLPSQCEEHQSLIISRNFITNYSGLWACQSSKQWGPIDGAKKFGTYMICWYAHVDFLKMPREGISKERLATCHKNKHETHFDEYTME